MVPNKEEGVKRRVLPGYSSSLFVTAEMFQWRSKLLFDPLDGWGKGLVTRTIQDLLGLDHIAMVRKELFTSRYELARYAGKKVLIHPDMPVDFLKNQEGDVFKRLVGGDMICADIDTRKTITFEGCFGVVFCCNGRLMLPINADRDAWRRRLAVIEFGEPCHNQRIGSLSELILKQELSGVLNWMLEGRKKVRKDLYQINLTNLQELHVDRILEDSEPHRSFVRECLTKAPGQRLLLKECYPAYLAFCKRRGICPAKPHHLAKLIEQPIQERFGENYRHDLLDDEGKNQRGWMNLGTNISSCTC